MKKITLLLLSLVLIPISLLAVKAYPGLVTKTLPDGSELQIRIYGDEYFSYSTTSDGYLICENQAGYFEYATLESNGSYKLSGTKARPINLRTNKELRLISSLPLASEIIAPMENQANTIRQKAAATTASTRTYPLSGSPKSLVILVNFSDKSFVTASPQTAYTNLLNEDGYSENGATGSARDYFEASSFNQFSPVFDVVGPYTLPNNMAYYGAQSGSSNDANPADMVRHACSAAISAGVDFSQYDTDNDGFVDNVFVYYAGYNQAEGGGNNTIWPHRSRLYPNYQVADGLYVVDYACTSELRGSYGSTMCGVGTFCHEFGHVLGLPDWYDTNYGEMSGKTPQSWTIMDQGSYTNNGRTPPTYSGYERFYLGWTTPQQLVPGQYTATPLITTNQCYLAAASTHNLSGKNPNPSQFFIIENREALGWDANGIPAEGLLITRINYNAATWASNTPNNYEATQGYQVICAYGTTSSPSGNTYPGTHSVTAAYLTLPDGTDLNQPLTNIVKNGNEVSFLFAGGGEGYPSIVLVAPLQAFRTPGNTSSEPQIMELIGTKLSEQVSLTFATGKNYEMRFETEDDEATAPYVKTLSITPDAVDSSFHARIQVRFSPVGISYNNTWTDNIKISSTEFTLQVPVSGVAPRPVYVVPPVAYEAEDVTPYSFKASWSEVYDAQGYYLTLHTIDRGVTGTMTEAFSTFDSSTPFGWSSTFNTTTRAAVNSSPQAAFFKTSSDTLTTDTYFMPVSSVSFWVQAYNSVGVFTFEAYNGESWVQIDQFDVNTALRAQLKEYPFSEADNYIRFRMSYDYYSGNGGLAFDDFTANTSDKLTYILQDRFLLETEMTIDNLEPKREYMYRVKATDQDLQGRYENITEYSNQIEVETLEGSAESDQSIMISIAPSGDHYMVYVADYTPTSRIYIYTADGKLVSEITPTSNQVELPTLASGIFYLLKYSDSEVGIKRKDKYAKFFYAL